VVPIAKHRIDEAVKQGAKVLIGGSDLHLDPWKGTFFTPTLLLGAPQSSEFM
jgi:acyl-CoA reductase-like NAD-dependent aldehyde dehydrogenase